MNDDLKRWDEEAEDWVNRFQKTRTLPIELIGNYLKANKLNFQGKKILDVGCGDGVFTAMLAELDSVITGVDGSAKMIEYARALHPDYQFEVLDALKQFPYPDSGFDVVANFFLLMSLSEIGNFLKESNRILKQNGLLVSIVLHPAFNFPTLKPYRTYWEKLTGKPVNGLVKNYFTKTTQRRDAVAKNPWPYYHRTIEDYTKEFADAGFAVKNVYEPHELSVEYLRRYAGHEIATRLPRFMIFECTKL